MTNHSQRVCVTLPLPPRTLGKGASFHWRAVRRDYADYGMFAYIALCQTMDLQALRVGDETPWAAARMDIEWRSTGARPDDDNVVTRCATYRDAVQHAGLVSDDRTIRIGNVTFTRVKRADQGCVVTFTKEPA